MEKRYFIYIVLFLVALIAINYLANFVPIESLASRVNGEVMEVTFWRHADIGINLLKLSCFGGVILNIIRLVTNWYNKKK